MVDNDPSLRIEHVEGSNGLEFNTTRIAVVGVPAAVFIVAGLVYLTSAPAILFIFSLVFYFAYGLHTL